MASRLLDYLCKNSILTQYQFGFIPNYSTELAIHQLCQNIYNDIDNKEFQVTLFCDLTKAFDTISHSILLENLEVYGIRGTTSNWFKRYLIHRQ